MNHTWITSDQHFGHRKIWEFVHEDGPRAGERIRNFATAEDGDEVMIARWNEAVKPGDKVYCLGDVVIKRSAFSLLPRLNGNKVLIRGNHDIFKLKDYTPHFCDIRGTHKVGNVILSHYPIHPESYPKWCVGNIHGHTHGRSLADPRYLNACVERFAGYPFPLDWAVNYLTRLHESVAK